MKHPIFSQGFPRLLPKQFRLSFSSLLLFASSALATDGTWTQTANTIYSNTSNWTNGVVASGTGATMTITKSGPTIVVDSNVTIGALTGAWNSSSSMNLSGSSGVSLAFASSSSTPSLSIATYFSRYDYVTNLNISGSQGLNYIGASNVLVLKSGVTWTGFSGTFTITPPGNGDGGILYAQAAGVLPGADLTMTPGNGSNAYAKSKLVLNAGSDQTIGALNSTIAGSNTAYISSYTSSSILTGGSPLGTNTNGYSTLTIGTTNASGTFQGKVGVGYTTSGAEDTTAHLLHITKTGTGTQTFSGANIYSGTTTVSAGTLVVTGTHAATVVSGSDTGRYVVSGSGVLGGTGTIKPSTTLSGSDAMMAVSGMLAPGVSGTNSGIGTLTLDGANSTKPLLSMQSGGKLGIDLGASLASDKVAIVNGGTGDVVFNSNAINFTDTASGALTSGTYMLIDGDASTTYSGLTVDGSNVITAGLSIGSGLGAYPGSQLKVVGNDIVLNLVGATPQPVALGFNMKASANTGMTSSELAGAPGVRYTKWNNFNLTTTSGSLSSIVDSNGGAVTGMNVSFAGGNVGGVFSRNTASPSNDTRMFDTVIDHYDTTQSTVTVTGIPYATYDVYFYMNDDGSARGGRFTVSGTTYYLRGGVGNPTSSGSNYVQSTDTTFNSGSDTQANYVKFTGVSGGTLTATFVAVNEGDSTQRLKMPGFQIVGSTVPPTVAPSTPTGVTAIPTTGQVTVSWSAVNTATSYIIYRSTSPDSGFASINTVDAFSTSYADSTVTNGVTYYYKIVASNGVGAGTTSSSAAATPIDPLTISVIGVHLRAYSTYGMAVTDSAGVIHVPFWNNLVGPQIQGQTGTLTSPTDHLGVPLSGVSVSWTAGSTTTGAYGNSGTIKTGSDAVTVGPASHDPNLFASVFDQFNGTSSTLAVTGIPYSSYDAIFYIYDGGASRGGSITVGGTTYYIKGGAGTPAADGTGYVQSTGTSIATAQSANYVRFTGLSGSTCSATFVAQNFGDSTQRLKVAGFQIASNVAVSLPTQVPAAPTSLTASNGNRQVALNWNAAATATTYKIYRGTSSGSYTLLAGGTVSAPMTSYADTTATNGTTYYYAVSAVNGIGEGVKSSEASATPATPSFTEPDRTVYQWSLPMEPIYSGTAGTKWAYDSQRRAYLWVPPNCAKVQGVMVGLHNMLEKPMFDDPAIRQACADANLAILFIAPGDSKTWTPNGVGNYTPGAVSTAIDLDPNNYVSQDINPSTGTNYPTDINPATGTRFANQSEQAGAELAQLLANFATESGYNELQYAPVLLTDHSAGSPFCWGRTVASSTALTGRVFAILPNKGTFPGNISNLLGVPIFHVASEYQEISNWGNTWELGDAPAMRGLRAGGTNCLIGECVQPGTGHYEYAPEHVAPLAAFIKAAAAARIPPAWSPTTYPALYTITPSSGYLIDVTTLGSGTAQPVAYNTWVGAGNDPLRAYWYPDLATAQAVCDVANVDFSKKPQVINAYTNSTTLAPLATQSAGYATFAPTLQGDGVMFQVRAASLNQCPVARLYNGSPVGIASGPILFRANGSGSLKQTGADTFRIWLDRESLFKGGQPWEPFVLAYHPGDSNFRPAYRPIQINTAAAVNLIGGSTQTISFPTLPDVTGTNLQTLTLTGTLGATASSGLPVQYWVASGPYRSSGTNGEILIPNQIPPGTKFPMRVVIGAWQWGRPSSVGTAIQSAAPVYNTFWIFKNGIEKWRFDNFGYYSSGTPVTPAGNSDDTANPSGDGIPNLMKYATRMSPLTSSSNPPATLGQATATVNGVTGPVLTLTFNRIADATLTYAVQATDDLTSGNWTAVWSSTGAANANDTVTAADDVLINDPAHPRRFLRLRVSY